MRILNSSFLFNTLYRTQTEMNSLNRQLSTGLRINSAADDPSGMVIASKLKGQIRQFESYSRNANDAMSTLNSIDNVLSRGEDYLRRMQELAVEGQDSTLSNTQRTAMQNEYTDLRTALNNLTVSFQYNGISFLNQTASHSVRTGFGDLSFSSIDVDGLLGPSISATNLNSTSDAQNAETGVIAALDLMAGFRQTFGAKMSLLDMQIETNQAHLNALESARSNAEDADMAKAMSKFTRLQLIEQSNMELLRTVDSINFNILSLYQ